MIDRPSTLIIIDNDPIFRLGLVQSLSRLPSLSIIAEGNLESIGERTIEPSPDIILIDPRPENTPNWPVCQSLQERYPDSKLILLSSQIDARQQLTAQGLGIVGYIPKGTSLETLMTILRQLVLENRPYWPTSSALNVVPRDRLPPTHWLIRTSRSGLSQIERELGSIETYLNQSGLSGFDRVYWQGRRRELLTALWLVRKLVPLETTYQTLPPNPILPTTLMEVNELAILNRTRPLCTSIVFEDTLAEIRSLLRNGTTIPFEIDVLQETRKRELLYLILDKTRKLIDELRFLQISAHELSRRKPLLIYEIWQETTRKFLEIYGSETGDLSNEAINSLILEERDLIQAEILDKIPFVLDLLTYLVYEKGLMIDRVEYRAIAPETLERAEILLQNLIHHIANGVMVVILNNFSESPIIKQKLYRQPFLSSREIARMRNELSWKYRREKYWEEPKSIFESEYRLFRYQNGEIKKISLYAPRQEELTRLTGIRWIVSITLELVDSLSPRLRAVFSVVGKGVVYFLIQVIGRGIGLITRGILQGVGNTWQEVKSKK